MEAKVTNNRLGFLQCWDRVAELPLFKIGPPVDHDGEKERRIELRCPSCEFLGRRRVVLEHERDGRIEQDLGRQRIQFDRALEMPDCLV